MAAALPALEAHLLNPGDTKKLLREDDSLLRQIFFSVLKHHHPNLANKVDVIYALSQAWCSSQSDDDFDALEKYLQTLKPEEAILVASSFSHMLNLHNLSEDVASSQTERAARMGEVESSTRTTNKSFLKLTSAGGVTPDQLFKVLCEQNVELVFTAHPTQALRQSLLKKYAKVRQLMDRLHTERLSPYEKIECLEAIKAQVQAAWRTDEIRRQKPSPQDEMRHGLSYFQSTIVDLMPVFLRRIDTALANIGLPRLPLDHALFSFGSWMGGDRDGNPNVTSGTTRDVVLLARLEAVNAYFGAIEKLMFDLSIWRCSPELKEYATRIADREQRDSERVAEERKKRNYADFWTPIPVTEPFRLVLSHIRDRLYATREVLHQCLINPTMHVVQALEERHAYQSGDELFRPLKLMYDSLISTKDDAIANLRLLDLLRQVKVFGMSLTKLDIRQESTRHAEMMDAVTTFLGLGSYASWNEEQRLSFLLETLTSRRPLMPPGIDLSHDAQEVIDTFRVLAELPSDSLGAYIISMARTASDVLAVVLLQREAGIRRYLRVVPLFETLDDLKNAPDTMRTLLGNAWYHKHINGQQECMIGYSDSGKDAGRLAAAWSLFETQEKIVAVAEEFNVRMVLFHGRGGSVGRGGAPTHVAIRSQPPGTIKDKLRVTVQGEIIEQQFGEKEVCFRTMDLYTSAMLEAGLDQPPAPKQEWRDMMDKLSKISCEHYRNMVFGTPDFVEYFRTATPVGELGRLNIGSRPSARSKAGGIETLRAIPWVFAWTQTRFHLPVWLGVGEALDEVIASGGLPLLQEMYDQWPFFRGTMDMVEMVMAKADPRTTAMYDSRLVRKELQFLGDTLRQKFNDTKSLLLKVVRKSTLLEDGSGAHPQLDEKLRLREPYVAPLNVLQVMCMKQQRDGSAGEYRPNDPEIVDLLSRDPASGPSKDPLKAAIDDCLMITIKGIAAGMQNTG